MKKIENTFVVTGFVGNNAEIRQFTNASVARFSLAVSRQEKNGEETNRVSAFMNMEAWRKNEHVDSFDKLQKGTMLTVEGYFKPDEWVDQQGTKHNRIVFIANKFYPTPDKEEAPTLHIVAHRISSLCIYTKEIIGQTSAGMLLRYQSFRRLYVVSKVCFTAD